MKVSDLNFERIIKQSLDKEDVSTTFNEVWNVQQRKDGNRMGSAKIRSAPKVVLASLLVLLAFGFAFKPIAEKTDYPFINDPTVIGKWQSIDMVSAIDEFNPDKKTFNDDLYIYELVFVKDGEMLMNTAKTKGNLVPSPWKWTQGLVINIPDKLAPNYSIKGIEGKTYMFLEEKNGEYKYFHLPLSYRVLIKLDDQDYSGYRFPVTEDKIDYAFVDDPQLIGQWETVDYVDKKDQFSPGSTQWRGEVLLKGLEIASEGKVVVIGPQGNIPDTMAWTKGLILSRNDKTASQYEIKSIRGDIYLFLEFKSGDYTQRGMDPGYCVFKKQIKK